jgi:hypothetical protein
MNRAFLKGLAIIGMVIFLAACNNDTVDVGVRHPPVRQLATRTVADVVSDSTMGVLSPLARQIAFALRDSMTRVRIARAMKNQGTILGLDLQACDDDTEVSAIFTEGERQGGATATKLCTAAMNRSGAVLYMDRDRLSHWDGAETPIVTAVASPDRPLRKSFLGYVAPDRVADLPVDGDISGPVLVVLPYTHRLRVPRLQRPVPTIRTIQVAPDTTGTRVAPPSSSSR